MNRVYTIKAKYLNTRVGSVSPIKFNLRASEKFVPSESTTFYCSYKRLNRGVMLPNGLVTICCQDYGLQGILGSLSDKNLDSLYEVIESDPVKSDLFLRGKFAPCNACEHYMSVDAPSTSNRS